MRCTEVSTINSVFSLLSPPVTFHPEKGHRLLINICRGNSLLSSICTRVHFVMLYLYNGTVYYRGKYFSLFPFQTMRESLLLLGFTLGLGKARSIVTILMGPFKKIK